MCNPMCTSEKILLVMQATGIDAEGARAYLCDSDWIVVDAIKLIRESK